VSTTSRLAVIAHFDPRGGVAPHTRRHVEALASSVQEVVVVTTSDLTESSRRWFSSRVRLIERTNRGYDFFSYKTGLDASDLSGFDEVVICNDSFVGPLVSYDDIFGAMAERPVDFWGLTVNRRWRPHIQTFFVAFRSWLVRSPTFREFWADLEPLSDRSKVINRYEIGMTERLSSAGFAYDSYFQESEADRALGRRRVLWWWAHRQRLPRSRRELDDYLQQARAGCNPSAGMADRALDGGRLPYVKIDTLRYDPYGLNADKLLRLCEQKYPSAFEDVRGFLARTARDYPQRPGEVLRRTPMVLRPVRHLVEYGDGG